MSFFGHVTFVCPTACHLFLFMYCFLGRDRGYSKVHMGIPFVSDYEHIYVLYFLSINNLNLKRLIAFLLLSSWDNLSPNFRPCQRWDFLLLCFCNIRHVISKNHSYAESIQLGDGSFYGCCMLRFNHYKSIGVGALRSSFFEFEKS